MKLVGIELQNFRSIGEKFVVLKPLRQCNILIGQNNSGKSNTIAAVKKISDQLLKLTSPKENIEVSQFERTDYHFRTDSNQFKYTLSFQLEREQELESQIIEILQSDANEVTFTITLDGTSEPKILDNSFALVVDFNQANKLSKLLIGQPWDFRKKTLSEIRYLFTDYAGQKIFFNYFLKYIPPVEIIPEFRQIQPGEKYSFNGAKLIGLLHQYQHPKIGSDYEREKFDKIQTFIRHLLHAPNAYMEVTHENTITLTNDNLRLPLSSYGTGVHELVIMLTAILSEENTIFCIEEPEIHLHPSLQREFIELLTTQTNNTFLLSTHSPTLINARNKWQSKSDNNVQIFRLYRENGATVGGPVLTDLHSLSALSDLGVKASDILQSNSIIWVEGPSDRIYLNCWINLVDPELIEGLHYSIMFYGGRLLSHLSTERDEEEKELIDLLSINQHAIIMIDSDRDKVSDTINATKQRIKEECEKSACVCWITDGREVENYLNSRVIIATVKELFKELFDKNVQFEQKPFTKFDDAIYQALKNAGYDKDYKYSGDKVRFAKECVKEISVEDMDNELREKVELVVEKIQLWNK